jgi:hypothetical protein
VKSAEDWILQTAEPEYATFRNTKWSLTDSEHKQSIEDSINKAIVHKIHNRANLNFWSIKADTKSEFSTLLPRYSGDSFVLFQIFWFANTIFASHMLDLDQGKRKFYRRFA